MDKKCKKKKCKKKTNHLGPFFLSVWESRSFFLSFSPTCMYMHERVQTYGVEKAHEVLYKNHYKVSTENWNGGVTYKRDWGHVRLFVWFWSHKTEIFFCVFLFLYFCAASGLCIFLVNIVSYVFHINGPHPHETPN